MWAETKIAIQDETLEIWKAGTWVPHSSTPSRLEGVRELHAVYPAGSHATRVEIGGGKGQRTLLLLHGTWESKWER